MFDWSRHLSPFTFWCDGNPLFTGEDTWILRWPAGLHVLRQYYEIDLPCNMTLRWRLLYHVYTIV